MAESIFTTQTPAVGDANDGPSTLGTLFTTAVAGTIDGIRWYVPTTLPSSTCDALLYRWDSDTTGTLLGQVSFGTLTANTWNSVNFASPISIVAGGQRYVACIFTPDHYDYTNFFFTSSGVTNGNLTAPQNDDVTPAHNGKFIQNATPAYPDQTFRQNCYFVDVLFTASAAPTAIPIGLATETDTASSITPLVGGVSVAVDRATETDTAASVTPLAGPVAVPIGLSQETDTAAAVTPVAGPVSVSVGRSTETDAARAITPLAGGISVGIGRADETDTAQSITPGIGTVAIPIGRADETDTARSITPLFTQTVAIGRAQETDTAGVISVRMSSGRTPFSSGPCADWEPLWCGPLSAAAMAVTGDAVTMATDVLWHLSGQRFGLCEVTLRPCRDECGAGFGTWDDWWTGIGSAPYLGSGGPRPWWADGVWYNVCGGCANGCSCTELQEAILPAPTREVLEVRLDGVVLNPTAYRVDENRRLVRVDGNPWPYCQDMAKSDDQPGTWSVTITVGETVPTLARRAVADLAAEFAKDCAGEDCAVPYDVTSLTRQGITLDFGNPSAEQVDSFVRLLGLRTVRLFLGAYNPFRLQRRGKVYDVERTPNPWRRVDTS